jgi:hypothetical protein
VAGQAASLLDSLSERIARFRAEPRTEGELSLLAYAEWRGQAMADGAMADGLEGGVEGPLLAGMQLFELRKSVFLLTNGGFHTPAPRPRQKKSQKEEGTRRFRKSKLKECFANAQRLALAHDGLTYCEGLAWADGVPLVIEHGWCLAEDDSVIDVTWDAVGAAYFGIPFRRQFVGAAVFQQRDYSPLLDGLVRSDRPVEDWKQSV